MLQGLYIPWGVMVDTWDLTFSSTSDVPVLLWVQLTSGKSFVR